MGTVDMARERERAEERRRRYFVAANVTEEEVNKSRWNYFYFLRK
jgi:hypothetical protein